MSLEGQRLLHGSLLTLVSYCLAGRMAGTEPTGSSYFDLHAALAEETLMPAKLIHGASKIAPSLDPATGKLWCNLLLRAHLAWNCDSTYFSSGF